MDKSCESYVVLVLGWTIEMYLNGGAYAPSRIKFVFSLSRNKEKILIGFYLPNCLRDNLLSYNYNIRYKKVVFNTFGERIYEVLNNIPLSTS